MWRELLAGLALFCTTFAWAQRTIPDDMNVAVLKKVEWPQVTLSNGGFSWVKLFTLGLVDGNAVTVPVSRLVRIKDETDRYIVMGRLGAYTDKVVAVRRDEGGVIREIWILNEQETAVLAEQAQ